MAVLTIILGLAAAAVTLIFVIGSDSRKISPEMQEMLDLEQETAVKDIQKKLPSCLRKRLR